VIATQEGLFGGWGLYLREGKPVFHYDTRDVAHYEIVSQDRLAPGKHTIRLEFQYDGGGIGKGGTGRLLIDEKEGATGRIEKTIPVRVTLDESLDFGEDTGAAVNLSYDVPFPFSSRPGHVTIELK
jgi:arylsulfatase